MAVELADRWVAGGGRSGICDDDAAGKRQQQGVKAM
jgi:hypothetical protein